jgi:Fe-S oxidoreductase
MENSGQPVGHEPGERADWAKALEGRRHRPSSTVRRAARAEYLYWVGCAGSFDDKNKKVTQAMAKLLQRAGISFAILGPSEMCTGDPARRSGNEYIFQMLAMQNIETLERHGREEDHHAVPPLLQHAEERVPAARRQLRGRAPQPVPRAGLIDHRASST